MNALPAIAIPGVGRTLSAAIGLFATTVVLCQCRRPRWFIGRLFARQMNVTHRALTTWGLDTVELRPGLRVLDVGCGGGAGVAAIAARLDGGTVVGIDYSSDGVATARRTNAAAIAAGRVEVRQGSVTALPFEDGSFDVVTAFETHYYWPGPDASVAEAYRVLRDGGSLAIVAETYRGRRMDWLYRPAMWLPGATYLMPDEHRALLERAGFADVRVSLEPKMGWISAQGRKRQ